MYLKFLITFTLALLISLITKGQCNYIWKRADSKDTFLISSNLIVNKTVDADSLSAILSSFRDRIRVPPSPQDYFYDQYVIDSLERLPADSLIVDEISFRQDHMKSVFQDHMLDSVGFVLYNIDTFSIEGKRIVVYQISSNLETFWNEDFANWMFLYTKDFGIIRYSFYGPCDSCPGFDSGSLVSNCHLSVQEIKELHQLQNVATIHN